MSKALTAIKEHGGILPAIAMALALASVSQACFYWFHQPDLPKSLMNNEE